MKISAIVPAYNEEKTILNVLYSIEEAGVVDEVIVVNDASTDRTPRLVQALGGNVKLVNLPKNRGKGAALKEGIGSATGDVILLLDADLIGLQPEHIYALIQPVVEGTADMTRGVFTNGRKTTDLSHKIAPGISGQRAVRKDVVERIPNLEKTRFGVELALNRFVKKNKLRMKPVEMVNITHRMKEEKFGLPKGFAMRLKMYWDILKFIGNPRKDKVKKEKVKKPRRKRKSQWH